MQKSVSQLNSRRSVATSSVNFANVSNGSKATSANAASSGSCLPAACNSLQLQRPLQWCRCWWSQPAPKLNILFPPLSAVVNLLSGIFLVGRGRVRRWQARQNSYRGKRDLAMLGSCFQRDLYSPLPFQSTPTLRVPSICLALIGLISVFTY